MTIMTCRFRNATGTWCLSDLESFLRSERVQDDCEKPPTPFQPEIDRNSLFERWLRGRAVGGRRGHVGEGHGPGILEAPAVLGRVAAEVGRRRRLIPAARAASAAAARPRVLGVVSAHVCTGSTSAAHT